MMRLDLASVKQMSKLVDRRSFLFHAACSTTILTNFPSISYSYSGNNIKDQLNLRRRGNQAYKVRHNAALYQRTMPNPANLDNGDDSAYHNKIASYSKSFPHNQLGEVDTDAYGLYLRSLASSNTEDFEEIRLGGSVKLTNPQAAYAFVLEGSDSHYLGMPPSPKFSDAETAGEMVELYWQALTRDIPYSQYESEQLINTACTELSSLSDFRGPKYNAIVHPSILFRGNTDGDHTGPYISQFLWKDVPYGATPIVQKIKTLLPEIDYLTSYSEWLAIQNGSASLPTQYDSTPRYVRNNRDLAEYVHRDFTYQLFLNACLILLGYGKESIDESNPYKHSRTQAGFSTFGAPHILDMTAKAANYALMAAWYQKWLVHRRLRPEEFGGRIHNHLTRNANYPLHSDVINSSVLISILHKNGNYLLPMAYPEGCPTHPAYPAGHAVIAGACSTILKAFFNESFVIPNPVEADNEGLSLYPYDGDSLTVGGELNKLASNVAIGRNAAGVHWRSDGIEGLRLGELIAIRLLQDFKHCYNERFAGFTLRKFDGITVTI